MLERCQRRTVRLAEVGAVVREIDADTLARLPLIDACGLQPLRLPCAEQAALDRQVRACNRLTMAAAERKVRIQDMVRQLMPVPPLTGDPGRAGPTWPCWNASPIRGRCWPPATMKWWRMLQRYTGRRELLLRASMRSPRWSPTAASPGETVGVVHYATPTIAYKIAKSGRGDGCSRTLYCRS